MTGKVIAFSIVDERCEPHNRDSLFDFLVHIQGSLLAAVFCVGPIPPPHNGTDTKNGCKEATFRATGTCNRPIPSSCLPPLQSESKCEVFLA